ncbi:MAG: stage IV sporulation protein A [Candidatus Coproplasma sp.]
MLNDNIYQDVAARGGGNVYIGVVGPVRTGKSTLIKKFMTELVLPNVEGADRAEIIDELPQSAAGRTVMTTEPKFVPSKAARVKIDNAQANVRLIDCVGFIVDGANGFEEDGAPRLVKTMWQDSPLPFAEAAALGTQKVIRDHSTIGILVTTDGSIADIPRSGYVAAEERTVEELKKIGKPFVTVLNCADPDGANAQALRSELEAKYGCTVIAMNCETADANHLKNILRAALFEFPVVSFDIKIPEWVRVLPADSSAVSELLTRVRTTAQKIERMKDCSAFDTMLSDCGYWKSEVSVSMSLDTGKATVEAQIKDGVFFSLLSEMAGESIGDECSLMSFVTGAAQAKKSYDKVKDALECARVTGYGIVTPDDGDMNMEKPQVVRQGGNVAIKLRATAPSYHIVKVDVCGEVSPIMGAAAQSEDMVNGIMNGFEADPEGMWDTNLFGKSLRGMVKEGLAGKVTCMQEDTRNKMRRAITRIINEGKGGVICILL